MTSEKVKKPARKHPATVPPVAKGIEYKSASFHVTEGKGRALVNVDVRKGRARIRRVPDFPATLKRATIFAGDGAAMHRCGA